MPIYLAILSVLVVSAISLIGAFVISIREDLIRKYVFIFVSLAVGALLGDAFIHLIPEGLSNIEPSLFSLLIIIAIIVFFIIEKYLHWHHHSEEEDIENKVHPVGKMILISDGVHNFIDGLIVGASYLISIEVGIATTIAVVLHEIPQEIGDFGVLLHAGFSRTKALWFNFLSALSAVLGVLVVFLLGNISSFSVWLIPFSAGGFIYIALSDLIPELHKKSEKLSHFILQILMIAVGVISMFCLLYLE